jgi:hypothetical protein
MIRWRYLKSYFTFWFGLIWAGCGTAFIIVAIATYASHRQLSLHGVATSATVVEKGHDTDKDGDSQYWIRYLFHDAAGVEHVEVAKVKWAASRKYDIGAALPIRYLPDRPTRSSIDDPDAEQGWVLPLIFGIFGAVFGGIGWVLLMRAIVRSGSQASLMRHGVGVLGAVTAVEVNYNVRINRRHPCFLRYEFVDDLGQKQEGCSINLPFRLERRWNPGDNILVVHDRLDPSRHDADIFDVRADELHMLQQRYA